MVQVATGLQKGNNLIAIDYNIAGGIPAILKKEGDDNYQER